jgi:2-polyprenyl-3-methyl-5-hydroxy-6-metoxy-1,4-benzoquinol methylase
MGKYENISLIGEFAKGRNYDCSPAEPLQAILNELYSYKTMQVRVHHRLRLNLFYEILSHLQKKGLVQNFDNALDIGCNSGFYSKMLSDFGFKNVRGIDIDVPLVEVAKKNFEFHKPDRSLVYEVANAEELTEENKYDFVLCTEVIEHTEHQQKVIANIKRVLKPGGIAIVSLPNVVSLPFFLTYLHHKLTFKKIDRELRDHLSYPFFRSKRLFRSGGTRLVFSTGTNLFYWTFLSKYPFWKQLNKLNYHLSKLPVLHCFSQFYFIAIQKVPAGDKA